MQFRIKNAILEAGHCSLAAVPYGGLARVRRIYMGCSREKRPDCVHENPVLCMHEFIQNSATRFISCNFTRNSNTTRLRTAAPAEQVSNGSSWKHGGPGRAVVLFSQHPGDVSRLPTDPHVWEVGGRPCSTVRTVRTRNTDFGVTISEFLI